jgi:hypothetical protein
MPIRSLRTRLGLFWLLIMATLVSLDLIMLEVHRQGNARLPHGPIVA